MGWWVSGKWSVVGGLVGYKLAVGGFNKIHFKEHYKIIVIAIDLSKKQELDADPKAMQQINLLESSTSIERPKTKLSIFFLVVYLGKKWVERKQKSRESLCIKHRELFLKNKFAMFSDSTEECFNVVFLCLLIKKSMHLDES